MNEKQFIKEIFEIAFGDTMTTKDLLNDKDYETVIDKIMEFSDDALKCEENFNEEIELTYNEEHKESEEA
tara:strand:+ start:388 stop:597 length:210 start_codon:yes stop_codon:yes gene_type:complete